MPSFDADALKQATDLLNGVRPGLPDQVKTSILDDPNDCSLLFLQLAFSVSPDIVQQIRDLRDNFIPPVSQETRRGYQEALNDIISSDTFSDQLVRSFLDAALAIVTGDSGGTRHGGLPLVLGLGYRLAREARGLTRTDVQTDFRLAVSAIKALEKGLSGTNIYNSVESYLGTILPGSGSREFKAISFLLQDASRLESFWKLLKQEYAKSPSPAAPTNRPKS